MEKIERELFVVGGGVVEARVDGYRARSQIIEYLTGFLRHYARVRWATIATDSSDYTTKVEGIALDVINRRIASSIYSCEGLVDQLRHYRSFVKRIGHNTDVIVANLSLTSVIYVLLAKVFGGKILLYMGSDPVLSIKQKKSYLAKFSAALNLLLFPCVVFLADVVFVRGKSTFRFCSFWNRRVFLSHPIIAYSAFREPVDESDAHAGLRMLYVGKVEENKGVRLLLDAFATIGQERCGKCVSLDIVGSGPQLEIMRQKALAHGLLEHEVLFHGFVDDKVKLAEFFCRADLLIVPTMTNEGFPRVIDEAIACSLPVVCTRIGGMKYLEEEDGVCLVAPGDSIELAAVLGRYVADEKWRESMKLAAQARAMGHLKETASDQHAMAMMN